MFIVCLSLMLMALPALAQDATATPAPAAQDAAEAPAGQDTTSATDEPVAFLRFANFAPGTTVDFFMDGKPSEVTALEYKAFSDWTPTSPGTFNLSVLASGDEAAQSEPMEIELAEAGWFTIAAMGTADGGLSLDVIEETFDEFLPGTSWTTFVNAVQGTTNIDFVRNESTYTANVFPLGNEEDQLSSFGILDDVDTFDFRVVETENPDNVLVEAPGTELWENEIYLIAAVGTADPNDEFDVELLVENTSMAEVMMARGDMAEPGTIIEAAQAHPELAPWLKAVQAAGLAETLSGEGPFTVFVPADFVFDELPDDIRTNPEAMANLIQSQIVEGDLRSQDVFKAGTLTTLAGNDLTIEERGENAFVNDAQVINVNLPATNGVIHILNDWVILPEGESGQ
jgi:uncharacterized surface protein with fasciclin (FAS1) repeats